MRLTRLGLLVPVLVLAVSGCGGGSTSVDASGGAGGDPGGGGTGGSGGTGGTAAVSYGGCTFIGAIDRITISKCDHARELAFNVVLMNLGSGQPATPGLTLPDGWRLEGASAGPVSRCPSRSGSTQATTVTGSVTWVDMGGPVSGYPAHANIDVMLGFAADADLPASERVNASNVDVIGGCT